MTIQDIALGTVTDLFNLDATTSRATTIKGTALASTTPTVGQALVATAVSSGVITTGWAATASTLTQVLTNGNTANNLNLVLTGTGTLSAPMVALANTGQNSITLRLPIAVTTNYSLTLPGATPTYGQSLITIDGAGNTNWFLAGLEMIRLIGTSNITLSDAQTVDGVAVATGDRVLAQNQTNTTENGLYTANTGGVWTKLTTYPSQSVFATAGTVNANRTYTRNETGSPEQWILTGGGLGIVPTLQQVLTAGNTANSLNLVLTGTGSLSTPTLNLTNAGTNFIALRTPASVATSYALTLPSSTPTFGQALVTTNASGTTNWFLAGLEMIRLVGTSNITLTGAQTVDGVAVALNDRVLAQNQTNTSENGLYAANTAGAWVRLTTYPSQSLFVQQGTVNANRTYTRTEVASPEQWIATGAVGLSAVPTLQQVLNAGNTANNTNLVLTGTGALQSTAGLRLIGSTSGNNVSLVANTSTATYAIQLPAAQGALSTTLVNDGTGNLTWGSVAGNLTQILTAGNTANNLNLVLTGTGALQSTAGLRLIGSTSGNNVSLVANTSTATYAIQLPAAQGAVSTTLVNDGTGNLSWGSPNLQQVLNSGNSASATNISLTNARFITNLGFQLNGTSTGSMTFSVPGTVTSYTVFMPAAQGAANTTLVNDGFGVLSWAPSVPTLTQVLTNSNTANNLNLVLTGTGLLVSTAGLRLSGSTSGNTTIQAAATTSAYSLVLPAAQASAANQTLVNDGVGNLSWGTITGVQTRLIAAIATTGVFPLRGIVFVDNYTPSQGDLVLLTDQVTASEQGLYVVNTPGLWTKQTTSVLDSFFALNGTSNAGSTFTRTGATPNETYIRTAVNSATGALETLQQTCTAGNITNTGILLGNSTTDVLQLGQSQISKNAAGSLTIRAGTTITDTVIIGNSATTAVNSVAITGAATGTAPTIAAAGSDTNINLRILPKGTGSVVLGGDAQVVVLGTPSTTAFTTPLLAAPAANPAGGSTLSAGTSGQVLTSRGSGNTPAWTTTLIQGVWTLNSITGTSGGFTFLPANITEVTNNLGATYGASGIALPAGTYWAELSVSWAGGTATTGSFATSGIGTGIAGTLINGANVIADRLVVVGGGYATTDSQSANGSGRLNGGSTYVFWVFRSNTSGGTTTFSGGSVRIIKL